jgi:hypothetical protein
VRATDSFAAKTFAMKDQRNKKLKMVVQTVQNFSRGQNDSAASFIETDPTNSTVTTVSTLNIWKGNGR